MADYWIKWYIEILDDPKMATLPDRLWRRFSELCLISARVSPDKSGTLPDVRQIAWVLRIQTDDLQHDLDQLCATGMVEPIPNGWLIVNFTKRQAATPTNERVKQHRERKQKQQYYPNETDLKRSVTQSRAESEQSRAESEDTRFATLSAAFERTSGIVFHNAPKWIGAIGEMEKLGVTPDDIEKATAQLIEKEYTVVGPWSIVNATRSVISRRNGSKNKPSQSKEITLPENWNG